MPLEEGAARDLHEALETHLAGVLSDPFTLQLSDSGVRARCEYRGGARRCLAHCFQHEYYVEFQRQPAEHEARFETAARGRTQSKNDVLHAMAMWLAGGDLLALHRACAFVDQRKRSLEALEAQVLECRPGLHGVTHGLEHELADIYRLWFRSRDRSCRVSYYGSNEHPDAQFQWDECPLFEFRVEDPQLLSAVLDPWLCGELPTSMRREFPWLEISDLADHYEAGTPVEGEFLASWDWIQGFYDELRFPGRQPALLFLAALRAAGYDRKLRAGQSLWSLIVSRSRRHGLRADQPRIVFDFHGEGLRMHSGDGAEDVQLPRVALTPEIEGALRRLAEEEID